ncbi:MAG: hypothetical protein ACK6D3_22770 [Planctomycetaceae bacterium]|jgi:hypothetical protein
MSAGLYERLASPVRPEAGENATSEFAGGETVAGEPVVDDGRVPGWIAPGTPFTPQPRTARELMYALWQSGGQPVLSARRMGCSPRLVLDHIDARRRHWEEANYSRIELFELTALMLRGAVQRMDRWAVSLVGKTEWGQQALAPFPEPEHQWREGAGMPSIQELIPQVLEGLLDERHSIFAQCAARAGGHPCADGADGVPGTMDAGPASFGDRAGGAGDDPGEVGPGVGH